MINDPFSPEEQAIIQQIQAVPKLELGTTARAIIRERMLSEYRMISQQTAANAAAQTRSIALTVTGLIVITAIVIVVLAIVANRSRNTDSQTPTPTLMTLSASLQATLIATQPIPEISLTLPSTTVPQVTSTLVVSITQALPSRTETSAPTPTEMGTLEAIDAIPTTRVPAASAAPATITVSTTPELTITSTESSTVSPTPEALIVIEGPITSIVNNIITIMDFEIEVDVNHPILNLIEVGDAVHVEGVAGIGNTVVAEVITNLSSTPLVTGATVSLDGPVESINGNTIVVNGIVVQLDPNDPLLQTIQVNQFVSVQGNFQNSSGAIVLVVVSIVVNTNVTVPQNECWYHDDGMGMGHWHCDGMGMGMGEGGMGMGMEGG